MTERRYGFRFSAVEAGVLTVSVLFASALIFLSGIYVGKGVEAHRAIEQTTALRMPITLTNESRPPRTNTPLAWKLPKEKPTEFLPPDPSTGEGESLSAAGPNTQLLAAPPQKGATRKTLEVPTSPQERQEISEEKIPLWTEEKSTVSAKDKLRLGKESSLVVREKERADSEAERNPPVRTTAIQSRTNEKLNEIPNSSSVSAQKSTSGTKKWKVQVEATRREEVAREIAKSLRAQGYTPSVSKVQKEGEVLYRIRVGKFATQDEAVAAIGRFRRDGKFSQAYPVSE